MRLLLRADVTVGRGIGFIAIDPRLAALEVAGLPVGQAPRIDAVGDALLLVGVALHVGLQAPRRGRVRIAGRAVVLVAIDVVADMVLLAVDLRLLLRRQRAAALQIVRLLPVDVLLLALERAGLLGRQLAGLKTLLDAILLVRVALRFDSRALLCLS